MVVPLQLHRCCLGVQHPDGLKVSRGAPAGPCFRSMPARHGHTPYIFLRIISHHRPLYHGDVIKAAAFPICSFTCGMVAPSPYSRPISSASCALAIYPGMSDFTMSAASLQRPRCPICPSWRSLWPLPGSLLLNLLTTPARPRLL